MLDDEGQDWFSNLVNTAQRETSARNPTTHGNSHHFGPPLSPFHGDRCRCIRDACSAVSDSAHLDCYQYKSCLRLICNDFKDEMASKKPTSSASRYVF
ncbi:MAG: hypothetical protein RR779_21005 [Comamonas sp.]